MDAVGKTLEALHNGDRIADEQLLEAYAHMDQLTELLVGLGPRWSMASEAAMRDFFKLGDYIKARALIREL